MATDFGDIAKQFVDYYYQTFDSDRRNLSTLYRNNSMLTFESQPYQGTASIVEKLVGMPFQAVKHQLETLDAQPVVNGGVFVLVTGKLLVDEEQRPMSYTQAFQLLPEGGSYFVYNDIFRLIYA
ncbi:hypothetical protein DL766_002219 [Monosporascus sp. MC13-8B]|uniref:Nuclear transport factor 2 n=1 Tax=Monosporascus cannonballus TaxID=155416 RepID=A0ABY0GUF6_9PEZI|nr:hypothetical protein DL762_010510 [Monosporascus cannonballus]RYO81582.1 hypothetical protein DL763_008533 [Monosporascus cannonballus]RYP36037.1 hypothetical protein DL766_002219 [Monosporascus sp. MC13-8B]